MKKTLTYLAAFLLLFAYQEAFSQRIKRIPKKTPKKPIKLKEHYDEALKKGADISYKHTARVTIKQQTAKNISSAKELQPKVDRNVKKKSPTVSSQMDKKLINENKRNNEATKKATEKWNSFKTKTVNIQKTKSDKAIRNSRIQEEIKNKKAVQKKIDDYNYKLAKKELKSNPMNPARIIAGKGAKKDAKFKNAKKIAQKTNSKEANLIKVSSSKHGKMEAHGVVDVKSKKIIEIKPKNTYHQPQDNLATRKAKEHARVEKKKRQFKQEANNSFKDKKQKKNK